MPRHLPFSDSPLLSLRRLPFVSTVGCANSTGFQCGYAWHVMTSQTSPSSPMRAAQASPERAPFTLLLGACRKCRLSCFATDEEPAIFTEFIVTWTHAWVGCQN